MLKKYLIKEAHIDYILAALEISRSTKDATLIIAEQAIPCVLHMNIYITKNFISLLLQEGLNMYFYAKEKSNFIEAVENFMHKRFSDRTIDSSIQ